MRKIVVALVATMLSGSAIAQPPPPPPGGWNADSFWRGAPASPRERLQFLQDRVNRGAADGSLDRREAERVNHELHDTRVWIGQMEYRNNGPLGPDQFAQVQSKLNYLSRQINWLRHDGW